LFRKDKGIVLSDGSKVFTHDVAGDLPYKFEYDLIKRRPKSEDSNYDMDSDALTVNCGSSLSFAIELIYKFGYQSVILYGVDLYNSKYFWTDDFTIEVHRRTHRNQPASQPHARYRVKYFVIDFNKRWMLPNGREIFVGHKKTALYPDLRYKDITRE